MHPCPFDFQSLRVWAADERREDELKQMKHVDKERCRRRNFRAVKWGISFLFISFLVEHVRRALDSTIFGFLRITCQSLQL